VTLTSKPGRSSCRLGCEGVVVKDSIDCSLVFPALEDVTDDIGGFLPAEVCLLDHVEKREAVFCFLSATGSEATGSDREGAEVRSIEVAVQRVSERRIGHEHGIENSRVVLRYPSGYVSAFVFFGSMCLARTDFPAVS